MKYAIRKILQYLITIFLAVSLIFLLIRLAPGDPVEKILGPTANYEEIETYRKQLGLHQSLGQQYFSYIKGLFQLELGKSLFKKKDVWLLLNQYFPPTLILSFLCVSFSFLIGSLFGVILAIKRRTFLDHSVRILSLLGLSFPIFSMAPLLVLIFSIKLDLLPVSEWGEIKHMILPTLTLTIPLSAILLRVVRNRFIDDLSEPWTQVLASKGMALREFFSECSKLLSPLFSTLWPFNYPLF